MSAAQAVLQLGSISICPTMFDDISKRIIASFGESICLRAAARQAAERAAAAPAAQGLLPRPKVHGNCSRAKGRLEVDPLND